MEQKKSPNWQRIKETTQELLNTLHEELGWYNDEELKNTPRRITDFYKEWSNNDDFTFTTFKTSGPRGMIILKDIAINSMCSHHNLPFNGKAHIAYLQRDGGEIAGVSKLARTALKFASKPQQQENLSTEIVEYINKKLNPWFVMVIIEATHMCMVMRGVKQAEPMMVTSDIRWDQQKFSLTEMEILKNEVLDLTGLRNH